MFSLLFLALSFTMCNGFTPIVPIPFTGPVGTGLDLIPASKSMAYSKIKELQIRELRKNSPKSICDELNDAREIIRSPDRKNDMVSFLISNKKDLLYSIIYRVSDKIPFVYTIEAIVRNPDSKDTINILDLEIILKQQVEDTRSYLQIFNLKSWANGKYHKEKYLEEQFSSK